MAIYHFSVQVIKRSEGKSSVAAAAYRSGSKMVNAKTGEVSDYTKKSGVSDSIILAPPQSPSWVFDRETLWSETEKKEKRKDAQLAREIEMSIPRELPKPAMLALVKEFVQKTFVDEGMIADVNFHDLDSHNPHCHVMLSMREITPSGFGNKVRHWNNPVDRDNVEDWRSAWADFANKALAENFSQVRIDHRSYERQGLDVEPTEHLGSFASAVEKRGGRTERGDRNREVKARNQEVSEMKNELAALQLIRETENPITVRDDYAVRLAEAKTNYVSLVQKFNHAKAVYKNPENFLSEADKKGIQKMRSLVKVAKAQEKAVSDYLAMPWYRKLFAVLRDQVPQPPKPSVISAVAQYSARYGNAIGKTKEQARIAAELAKREALALRERFPELQPKAAASRKSPPPRPLDSPTPMPRQTPKPQSASPMPPPTQAVKEEVSWPASVLSQTPGQGLTWAEYEEACNDDGRVSLDDDLYTALKDQEQALALVLSQDTSERLYQASEVLSEVLGNRHSI